MATITKISMTNKFRLEIIITNERKITRFVGITLRKEKTIVLHWRDAYKWPVSSMSVVCI